MKIHKEKAENNLYKINADTIFSKIIMQIKISWNRVHTEAQKNAYWMIYKFLENLKYSLLTEADHGQLGLGGMNSKEAQEPGKYLVTRL